jgi:four helix bundle protein
LAESARTDACDLSTDRKISSVGTIWDRFAIKAIVSIGSREHCRGIWTAHDKSLLRCLQISRGELEETRYFLILSRDLQHISSNDFENMNGQCDSVGQLINALGRSLKNRLHSAEA